MSTSVGTTYQGSPFLVHWAANDNLKDLHPVKLHLTNDGELAELPGSVMIVVKELKDAWLSPIKHEAAVRLREWCTATYGPEGTNNWRFMSSGFVFFARSSDGMLFWMTWHQMDLQV